MLRGFTSLVNDRRFDDGGSNIEEMAKLAELRLANAKVSDPNVIRIIGQKSQAVRLVSSVGDKIQGKLSQLAQFHDGSTFYRKKDLRDIKHNQRADYALPEFKTHLDGRLIMDDAAINATQISTRDKVAWTVLVGNVLKKGKSVEEAVEKIDALVRMPADLGRKPKRIEVINTIRPILSIRGEKECEQVISQLETIMDYEFCRVRDGLGFFSKR